MKFRVLILFCALCSCFLATVPSVCAESPNSDFLRIRYSPEGYPAALESSVVHFRGTKFQVDLVSAVHVGEESYFEDLNRRFRKYDAVLYELIAPDGQAVPAETDKRSDNPVSQLQGLVKRLLALEFQLDKVDYAAKNFVHADLSPDAFMKAMSSRGESIWSLLARVLLKDMASAQEEQNSGKEIQILLSLLLSADAERPYTLRRHLAESFGRVDDLVAQLEGPSGSTLIADRNAKALEVLAREVKAGKKKLAIYYGAAHMPDIEKRLMKEFQLTKGDIEWIVAWPLQRAKER